MMLLTMEVRRSIVPAGTDPVAARYPVPLNDSADLRSFCRKTLENEIGEVRGSAYPERGSVHLIDATGEEVAKYDYYDLINDRSAEKKERRVEELRKAREAGK